MSDTESDYSSDEEEEFVGMETKSVTKAMQKAIEKQHEAKADDGDEDMGGGGGGGGAGAGAGEGEGEEEKGGDSDAEADEDEEDLKLPEYKYLTPEQVQALFGDLSSKPKNLESIMSTWKPKDDTTASLNIQQLVMMLNACKSTNTSAVSLLTCVLNNKLLGPMYQWSSRTAAAVTFACNNAATHKSALKKLAVNAGIKGANPWLKKREPLTFDDLNYILGLQLQERSRGNHTMPEEGRKFKTHFNLDETTLRSFKWDASTFSDAAFSELCQAFNIDENDENTQLVKEIVQQ